MKGRRLIAATASMISGVIALVACAGGEESPLIFVAASLVDVMEDVGGQYEQETGETVRFNFGGSNLLANQITAGASADAVIVAGTTPIEKLIDHGALESGETVPIFTNRLVVVAASASGSNLTDLTDLVDVGRIAMPDPFTAPAGEYFEAALKEIGVWHALQNQIIPTLDVRAALAAMMTGNVAYALVYETDAISAENVEIAFAIESGSDATKPRYYAARVSDDLRVDRFIAFLGSQGAMSIIEDYGFSR